MRKPACPCAVLARHPPPHHIPSTPHASAQDVFESDEAFKIALELPGVEASAIKVALHEGVLTITAQAGRHGGEGRWLHRERATTAITKRAFPLPPGVDTDAIEASLNNGVLEIVLPKVRARATVGMHGP